MKRLRTCNKNIFLVAVPTKAPPDVLDTCSSEVRSAISQVLGKSEATKTEAKQPAYDPVTMPSLDSIPGNILSLFSSVFDVGLVFGVWGY